MTYNSRSRKSNQDYDIENIDPMTVQTVIDTGYSELKIQEDAKKKIERKKIQQSQKNKELEPILKEMD
jgi:hypothetical protein